MTSILKLNRKAIINHVLNMDVNTFNKPEFYRGGNVMKDLSRKDLVNIIAERIFDGLGFCVHKFDIHGQEYEMHMGHHQLGELISEKNLHRMMSTIETYLTVVVTDNEKAFTKAVVAAVDLPSRTEGLGSILGNFLSNLSSLRLDDPFTPSTQSQEDQIPTDETGKKKLS